MSHDPHLLDPRHLPTPFSADEIRAAGSVNDPITGDMIPDGTLTVKEAGAITTVLGAL